MTPARAVTREENKVMSAQAQMNATANPWGDWTNGFMNEAAATFRRLAGIPAFIQRTQNIKKGASPSEVVYEEGRLKLLHYTSDAPLRFRTPQLFVFALVNRPYILDLKPGKSVIEHFVRAGFDTYLIDWGVPTEADRHRTLDDYINGSMLNVVEYLRERCNVPQVNLLGYCMGGTMSAMFTSLHQRLVRNLILLA